MTREELLARFPRASAAVLALNTGAPRPAPSAAPCPPRPVFPAAGVKTAPTAPTPRKSKGTASAGPAKPRASRVPKTRNAGTITEAAYWGMLRSGLRRLFRFWKPAVLALHAARIPCSGARGQKWAYVCADCRRAFPRKLVQIDHVEPCGALTELSHLPDFVRRLTPEDPKAYAVRCLACHQAKTNAERAAVTPSDTRCSCPSDTAGS